MSLQVQNLATFDATVQEWFSAVEEAAAQAAVGLARTAFERALEISPQSSGDFAANWRVSKNGPDTTFIVHAVRPEGFWRTDHTKFQQGDQPAQAYAKGHAVWPKIKLGESIFLSNSAAHSEPYAGKIEDGKIVFRPVNEGAEAVVRKSLAYTEARYSHIGRGSLATLRRFGS